MRLIAEGMEDYHRFLAGECRMFNAVALAKPKIDSQSANEFERLAHKVMTPELQQGASYKWSGGSCPNEHQRKAIAMSYMIYREILHTFAMQRPKEVWNTLQDPTLTCEEQGPLIKIKEAIL